MPPTASSLNLIRRRRTYATVNFGASDVKGRLLMLGIRSIASCLIAVSAVVVSMTTLNGVAQAAGSASGVSPLTEQKIHGLLKYNPGAKRIGPDSVELEKGVIVTVHPDSGSSGVVPAVSPSLCSLRHGVSAGWLCLYQNSNFGGDEIDFTVCANRNLGDYRMADGRAWNDQISSIDNDQTSGVQSRFYNYDGSGDPNSSANWALVIVVNAGHYLRDLSQDSSADGGSANDKIDIVHVC